MKCNFKNMKKSRINNYITIVIEIGKKARIMLNYKVYKNASLENNHYTVFL
ncbi:protein of unknown function [Tepidibacter aestuarii]|nr:protein of unknown function [Tepidibacter aestuarii]